MNKKILSLGLAGLLAGTGCATHNPVNRRYTKNCFQTALNVADELDRKGEKVYGFILYPIDDRGVWHCVLDMGDDKPLLDPSNPINQNPELEMWQDIKSKALPYVNKEHKMRRYVEGWVMQSISGRTRYKERMNNLK